MVCRRAAAIRAGGGGDSADGDLKRPPSPLSAGGDQQRPREQRAVSTDRLSVRHPALGPHTDTEHFNLTLSSSAEY